MKNLLSFFLLFIFGFGCLEAADKPLSAFQTLKIAQKQLGESGKHLLCMESAHAKLRPRYWWIRFYDEKLFLKARAVHMIGPEILENVIAGNPFDGGNVKFVIQPELLKYDSEKCISFMEKAAKENKIPLHSLNVRLEKPHPGESNPIWFFEWFDEANNKLGTIDISAATGKVTEIVGLKIRSKRLENVSQKTFGQDVEDTFLGIGGDMEEFFTGKRTVDQDVENSDKSDKSSKDNAEKSD